MSSKMSTQTRYGKDVTKEIKAPNSFEKDLKEICKHMSVVVLSQSTCPYSHEMKQTLASHGISFGVIETDMNYMPNTVLLPFFDEALENQYKRDVEAYEAKKGPDGDVDEFVSAIEGGKVDDADAPIPVPKPLPIPSLLINGRYYCDLSDLKQMEYDRDTSVLYRLSGLGKVSRPRVKSVHPFFQFPDAINVRQASVTSACYLITAAVCIAYLNRHVTMFAVLGLAIDMFAYTLYGPTVSGAGMVGVVLTCLFKPAYIPGAPRQAAAVLNTALVTLAAGLYLGNQQIGGAVVLGFTLGLLFVEVFGISIGAGIYYLLRALNYVPQDTVRLMMFNKGDRDFVYRRLLNALWIWKMTVNEKLDYAPAVKEPVIPRGQVVFTDIDLQRKQTSEPDYKFYNYGFLRFTRVDLFLMPMSAAALAFAFNVLAGETLIVDRSHRLIDWDYGVRGARDAIGIASAAIFCAIGAVTILRFVKHPKKVIKEWNSPITGNFFCALPICTAFYALLMYGRDKYFGIGICWIAVVFQMCYTVMTFSNFIFRHTSEEAINASLLLVPIGNFICSMALAQYPTDLRNGAPRITNFEVNYVFIARFWFSVGSLFALVLFTITLLKSFKDAHADPRVRLSLWNWQTTAAIAGPALYAITGNDISIGTTFPYQALWLIAVFFFAVNCVGWFKHFYTLTPDMSIWLSAFATSCGAISTAHYYAFVATDQFSEILTYIAIIMACASNALCFLHTCVWFLEGTLFKPKEKWGPATYLSLTNEAFRTAAVQLELAVSNLKPGVENRYTWAACLDQMIPFLVAYKSRTEQELNVIYPACRRLFPGLDPSLSKHTPESKTTFDRLKNCVDVLKVALETANRDSHFKDQDGKVAETIQGIKKLFEAWAKTMSLKKLTSADLTTSAILTKYFTIESQKELTEKAYDATNSQDWHIVIPFVVNHIAHPEWRVRYLRCLIWAMPGRAHEIGLIAYRTFDSITFAAISEQLPEIIPRGLSGYQKKF